MLELNSQKGDNQKMTSASWLALTDYSNKYQVSVSTLRRRIRSGRAEVRFVDGKYYLKDCPLIDHQFEEFIDSNIKDGQVPPQTTITTNHAHSSQGSSLENDSNSDSERAVLSQQEMPFMTTANTLLTEIKKAYMLVLQEKEEQILILKEEISNLNMLVKVLESENERLKNRPTDMTWNL